MILPSGTVFNGINIQQAYFSIKACLHLTHMFTWAFYGILTVQVYSYYIHFPYDPAYRKCVVLFVYSLETVQFVMVTADMYRIYVLGFENPFAINDLHLLPYSIPIFGGIIALTCQMIFANRIYLISKSKTVAFSVAVLSICSTTFSIMFGVRLLIAKTFINALSSLPMFYLTCSLWNGFAAACDILISLCLTYYLTRDTSGDPATEIIVRRIIRLTIETGLITATASVTSTILFVGFRKQVSISAFFLIPALIVAKMYAITLLATFNNRPGGSVRLVASKAKPFVSVNEENLVESNSSSTEMAFRQQGLCSGSALDHIGRPVVEIEIERRCI